MQFLRSSILKDYTAATEVKKVDLPTNPLSHLIISLDGYQMTDEATLAEIIAFINSVEVTHLGRTVLDLQSEDLAALDSYLYGHPPVLTNNITTDNATRSLSLIVPFGRRTFDPAECFPATKKGELTLSLDVTIPGTSIDNGVINIEAVELLEATPTHYLKSTLLTVSAPGATGDSDTDLPIGNAIVALILYNPTFPATASHAYTVDMCKVLVDNVEHGYASARAICLVGDQIFRIGSLPRTLALQAQIVPANYYWLDFDPHTDGNWLLDTTGKSSVKLRGTYGVDEATRLTVIELVEIS